MGKSRKKKLKEPKEKATKAALNALANAVITSNGTTISTIETTIHSTSTINTNNNNNHHTNEPNKPRICDLNALACAALASSNDHRVAVSSTHTATVAACSASISATTIDPMNLYPIINPTVERNIAKLPYIVDFQTLDNTKLISALLMEQKCSIAYEETHKLLSKYAHTRPDVDARLKARQDEMAASVTVATREVEKHYRQKAVRIHPDKLGEQARPQFELLTAARDVLKNATLRNLYIKEMVSVVHKVGEHFIPSTHQTWVTTNQPDGMQDLRTTHRTTVRSNAARQQHAHQQKIQLEGGLLFQKPRVPEIVVLDTTARLIRVSLPILRPEYQFYQYIHRIDITFTSPQLIPVCYDNNNNSDSDNDSNDQANNNNNTHKLSLTRSQITSQIIQNFYPSTIDAGKTILPSEGEWFVSWTATMQDATDKDENDKSQTKYQKSPPSSEACLEIMSAETIRRRIQRIDEDSNAMRSIRRIDSVLIELKRHKPGTSTTQYNVLHSAIVRAKGVQRRLFYLLKVTGELLVDNGKSTMTLGGERKFNHADITNQPFARLHQKIQDCAPTLLTLQTSRKAEVKKDALKMFKHHIATILESSPDILKWICNVQENDLHEHGGDANRLYQLFVEGKGKAFVLELDSDLLEEASARTDLFTVRQCKDLRLRGKAVKLYEEEDGIEVLAEKVKLEKEKEDKLVQKAKLSLVGETVKFRGLASDSGRKLNGKLGKVMEYLEGSKENGDSAGGDRYRVEYIGDVNRETGSIAKGKVFSVKPENMEANNSCYLESTPASTSTSASTNTTTIVPTAAIVVNSNNIEEVIEGIISGSIGGGEGKTQITAGVISGVISGSVGGETGEGKTKAPPQDPSQQKLQRQRQKKKQEPQPQSKDPHHAGPKADKTEPHESSISTPTANNQKEACKNKNSNININSSKENNDDGKSWSCAACTLFHEGRLALYMNCHACGLARGPRSGSYSAKISSTTTTRTAASAKNT